MSPSLFPSSLLRRRRCADPDSDENSFLNPKTKAHHSCNKNCWTFRSLSCAPKIFNYRIFIYIHTHTHTHTFLSPLSHINIKTHTYTPLTRITLIVAAHQKAKKATTPPTLLSNEGARNQEVCLFLSSSCV